MFTSRRLTIRILTIALPAVLLATAAFKVGEYVQGQPHMTAAMTALGDAQKHLEMAAEDKGGHRAKAMVHIKEAIKQVQAGIDYAAANH
jgi:hypothetical protein